MIVTVTLNPSLDRTLIVPCISFDEMIRATSSRLDWGGKGFNVSRALQALGVQSVAMGLVGGATGEVLEHGLSSMGIATDFVPIAGETRTNVIVAEARTGQYVKVNEPGPKVRVEELAACLDRIEERIRPGDLCVLSGSLPPGVPPDVYAQLVRLVQAGGAQALLDTSGEPLRLGCAAGPYLVKPNAAEVEDMIGHSLHSEADALNALQFFLQQRVELVALSLGAGGLLLASGRQAVRAKPPRMEVRGPVGAGDALLAGLTWALERRLPMDEMARWGVAAGTAAAAREGVAVGTRAEVQALYEKIQPKTLEDPYGLKKVKEAWSGNDNP